VAKKKSPPKKDSSHRFWTFIAIAAILIAVTGILKVGFGVDVPGSIERSVSRVQSQVETATNEPSATSGLGRKTSDREEALNALPLRDEDQVEWPSRDEAFGPRWKDVDRNGCDTRNDILARDLADVQRRGSCVVISGILRDVYTGRTIDFAKERASQVQIDHIVALDEAWESGARGWSPERRLAFANDPLNLQATIGAVNSAKGAQDGLWTWDPDGRSGLEPRVTLPREEYRCAFATQVIEVKTVYGLSVDAAERKELGQMQETC
jgi:Protein of unknown function (DUF1524)